MTVLELVGDHPGDNRGLSGGWWVTLLVMVGDNPWEGGLSWHCGLPILGMVGDHPWSGE